MLSAYKDFFLTDPSTPGGWIALVPGAALADQIALTRNDQTTYGGRLHTALVAGQVRTVAFPMFGVSSSDASVLNQWWRAQSALYFLVNSSAPPTALLRVRIANATLPLGQAYAARLDLFTGGLILRETFGADYSTGYPFQLDGAGAIGQLDNHNDLLL